MYNREITKRWLISIFQGEISCKGVINWDRYASLDELLDSMVATNGITEVERMKRRRLESQVEITES